MPTSQWNLPYPGPSDHTRTWEYWQALAEATDTALTAVPKANPVTWPGTPIAGLTVGNAQVNAPLAYRLGPNLVIVSYRLKAAASAPTTAWTSGNVTLTLPVSPSHHVIGDCYFASAPGAAYRVGNSLAVADSPLWYLYALRQTDCGLVSPSIAGGFGAGTWGVNAELVANMAYRTA